MGWFGCEAYFRKGSSSDLKPATRPSLRHDSTVVTCFYGQGITLEGFDIAHAGPGAGALVIQIQDLIGEPGGARFCEGHRSPG